MRLLFSKLLDYIIFPRFLISYYHAMFDRVPFRSNTFFSNNIEAAWQAPQLHRALNKKLGDELQLLPECDLK